MVHFKGQFLALGAIALIAAGFSTLNSCAAAEDALSGGKTQFCDGTEYNDSSHFCFANEVFEKCSNQQYNPDKKDCVDGRVVDKGTTGNTSSGSNNNTSSNSGGATAYYCDYGYEHSKDGAEENGGGCYEIESPADCDLEWGKLVSNCTTGRRTDLRYCDWGPKVYDTGCEWSQANGYYGGCFQIADEASCLKDYGTFVTQCSPTSLILGTPWQQGECYLTGYSTGGGVVVTPSSGSTTPSSGSTGGPTGNYCMFENDPANCWEIGYDDDLPTDAACKALYGWVVSRCVAFTNVEYCDWGPLKANGTGGCWELDPTDSAKRAECELYGEVVAVCPRGIGN